jgi:hypothetical protein
LADTAQLLGPLLLLTLLIPVYWVDGQWGQLYCISALAIYNSPNFLLGEWFTFCVELCCAYLFLDPDKWFWCVTAITIITVENSCNFVYDNNSHKSLWWE